ncbi:uncharacterized protein LOC8074247 [Sorghum bicolor]|uniref:Uncharacterized protein n=1 Tax=Sorghum bicolor TaxID=4558 RepID=C5YQB1_SORBI|nr:uncharacterized protein LOC8074247 [Sorghum bicolor]XP_021321912.1 uncharacterized protein LOC8074247 [Sorghum bicolor]XP_021321913.1 uncharacterized protein LOC8074247 [Sorghum bicolor]EES17243.1 hypothetical protein SORBI_3008G139000 [Sorghum bicolor]|eukprot:XP_002443405.1 uncharacterized protein LOC8074247 [Sorghum bicolor]
MASGLEQEQNSQPQSLGHIDEKWPEVMFINDYAVFIGYLSMAVTGTGFLVLTWSTVVLLGGFVTMLAKKDFWCLTVITLVQTRVFDVFLNGNISYIGYSFKRLWEAALSIALPHNPFRKWSARGLIRVLVFTTVLCPLFALYMFGLFISPGISLWRLLQQDYGDMAGDSSKANLKPALVVLYSLALVQGVLFYYRAISSLEEQRLLKLVAQAYRLDKDDKARGSISDYLREIRVGCEKDPSFARGRNLVTYAAGLMLSNSPDNYLSGARIIDTLIVWFSREPDQSVVESQRMLMNNMIGSASSSAIKKFVQMLDSKGQSDSEEIRSRAMRIVAHFASEIRLNKIPYGIQCISSFLESLEASISHHRHKETIIDILKKLTDDEENLRLMSNANGLALKIIKMLVDSDGGELHDSKHDRWCSNIAVPGMEVIKRFTSVIKRSNNVQLPRDILESPNAISTLESMLKCPKCKVQEELQKSVIMVLTQITSKETSLAAGEEIKKRLDEVKNRLILSLIAIFLDGGNGKSSVKKLAAGESLAKMSRINENSATILGAEDGRIVSGLTQVVLDKNSEYRKSAADILNHLCSHYTTNEDSRFQKLKKAMIDDVILPVLREVLGCRPTAEPRPPPWYLYLEDNVEEQEALSSLCATVHDILIRQDPNLATQFDQKAEEIGQEMETKEVMTFADLVKKAQDVVDNKRRRQSWVVHPYPPPQYVVCSAEEDPNSCCIS